MRNTYTQQTFIDKAIEIHRGFYGYELIEFVNLKTKVNIVCPIHGKFHQLPSNHLAGKGCRKCANKRRGLNSRLSLEAFIKKASSIHKGTYDYSLVNYITSITDITIVCKKHGEFPQTPNAHLSGYGCKKCANDNLSVMKTSSTDDFITKAMKIHKGKYDYSLVEYINSSTPVQIICAMHGEFPQIPNDHLSGAGCNDCSYLIRGLNLRLDNDTFIKRALAIHKGRYDYDLVEYVGVDDPVKILCKIHGVFEQTPYHHWAGHGCRKCAHFISNAEVSWLDSLNIPNEYRQQSIKTAEKSYKADAYDPDTNTVYEFYGDFWHGNPKLYNAKAFNNATKTTFGELYSKTIDRELDIKRAGYNLVVMWEHNWNTIVASKFH